MMAYTGTTNAYAYMNSMQQSITISKVIDDITGYTVVKKIQHMIRYELTSFSFEKHDILKPDIGDYDKSVLVKTFFNDTHCRKVTISGGTA